MVKYKGIIAFDLDGTLVDTHMAHVKAFQSAFQRFKLSPVDDAVILSQMGKPSSDIIRKIYPDLDTETIQKIVALRRQLFREKFVYEVKTMPYVNETLVKLKEDYYLAIASNSNYKAIDSILTAADIDRSLFDAVAGVDSTTKPKPYPHMLRKIEDTLSSPILYLVGDSIYDIIAAKKIGAISIIVKNNNISSILPRQKNTTDFLQEPDILIENISQLMSAVFCSRKPCETLGIDTRYYVIQSLPKDIEKIKNASDIIKKGGLVAFPTETVYGLGADALNPDAVRKIFIAKKRPADNPVIVHISDLSQMWLVASSVDKLTLKLVKEFWPGPLTVIVKRKPSIPDEVSKGLDTVAIRMPSNMIAKMLIKYSETPIAAPSANLSGKPSPTSAKHVFEDLCGRIDAIIDGGTTQIGIESTVVDTTQKPFRILRPGKITASDISRVIGKKEIVDFQPAIDRKQEKVKSPGVKYRHYSPSANMYIIRGELEKIIEYIKSRANTIKIGVIADNNITFTSEDRNIVKKIVKNDKTEVMKNIFRFLRECDAANVKEIYAVNFTEEKYGNAIMDRILKASGRKIIYL